MALPLEGITVVSLEQAVAAPFATRQLADMSARVIKVERPGTGDFTRSYDAVVQGLSSHFVWINHSKESIALDLKLEDAREVLNRLLEMADVFVQNLAPSATELLSFGTEPLRERHPRLDMCDVSGYGASEPSGTRRPTTCLSSARPVSSPSRARRRRRPRPVSPSPT
jgi:itaconate CoA-transferase